MKRKFAVLGSRVEDFSLWPEVMRTICPYGGWEFSAYNCNGGVGLNTFQSDDEFSGLALTTPLKSLVSGRSCVNTLIHVTDGWVTRDFDGLAVHNLSSGCYATGYVQVVGNGPVANSIAKAFDGNAQLLGRADTDKQSWNVPVDTLVINASGDPGVQPRHWSSGCTAVEMSYQKGGTAFSRTALRAGARLITGIEVLQEICRLQMGEFVSCFKQDENK